MKVAPFLYGSSLLKKKNSTRLGQLRKSLGQLRQSIAPPFWSLVGCFSRRSTSLSFSTRSVSFVGVRNSDISVRVWLFAGIRGRLPAARNYSVLPVGIFCTSFYPFKSKMLLIVLCRILVQVVSTLFWLTLFLGGLAITCGV